MVLYVLGDKYVALVVVPVTGVLLQLVGVSQVCSLGWLSLCHCCAWQLH